MENNMRMLGPVDNAFFFSESDVAPMNIGAVSIFEGTISFDEVLRTVDARIHRAPIYQQKVVQAPLSLGQPMWVFDPDFHIGNHVFHLPLEAPGTDDQLRQTVSRLISSALDRDKPLWEIHVISGLHRGERTAVLFKVHHAMVDGLAAVEIFTLLFDLSPDVEPLEDKPLYDPPDMPDTAEIVAESVKRDLPYKWSILKKVTNDLSNLVDVMRDKEKRRKTFVGLANLVNDNLQPIRKLPINGKNSGNQELAWTEFSLAEVRAIKSNRNASINDVMLTVLAGAIERYVYEEDPNNRQPFLRVLVPVSMRLEREKGDFGNRISVLTVDIPFETSDPLERLARVSEYSHIMKESSLTNGLDMVLTMPSLLPSMAQPFVWNLAPTFFSLIAHSWCTNVAGPQIPVYLRGHQLLHNYGFFPLNPSMGLCCVIVSYNQRISMTLVADRGIVPDVGRISGYLHDSFIELRSAAKVEPIEPIQIERSSSSRTATTNRDNGNERAADTASPVTVDAPLATQPATPPTEDRLPEPAVPTPVEAPDEYSREPVSVAATASPAPMPVADQAAAPADEPMLIFSAPWAAAYKDAINANPEYYRTSTRWTHGPLAFVMQASPANGYPQDTAVLLDLHKGKCRAARSVSPREALEAANFVIEGSYKNWMKALNGEAKPLGMLVRGQLRLKKGAITRLMPFTQSAQELINSAQKLN